MMDANAIHARLGADGWREVLLAAGLTEKQLRNKHGACPMCGGSDRYRFDNRSGRGDFICNQCGAGDGFKLVMGLMRVTFADARKRVMEIAGIEGERREHVYAPRAVDPVEIAKPTQRVRQLLKDSCLVEDCEAAMWYLASRELWPLPAGHGLRAHPCVDYYEEGRKVGSHPALLAAVRDQAGELVTVHVTYLTELGEKLDTHEPRKILSKLTGREGCAVPLMPVTATMGIAEGIETALSAARIHDVPVWAALNAGLLAKFQPPQTVGKLIIFADRDVAGLEAATALMQRLQEQVLMEVRTPRAKDWNDVLRGVA